jgi:hypothetical protein
MALALVPDQGGARTAAIAAAGKSAANANPLKMAATRPAARRPARVAKAA